jgi:hypothetical protein
VRGWFHRDHPGWIRSKDDAARPDAAMRHCTLHLPLRPGDRFHELVPGTHRRPPVPDEFRPGSQEEREARCDPDRTLPGAIRIELEPGDVLLRHPAVVHRGMNPEGRDRCTMLVAYGIAAGSPARDRTAW